MRCPGNMSILAAVAVLALAAACPVAGAQAESKSFMAQPGDTLVVQNDYGKIQVIAWESSLLDVQIRKNPPANAAIRVAAQKSGSRVFIYSFFSGSGEESVDLEIKAPAFMNAVLSGANPEMEIRGLQGFVRAQTFTGLISAEDLTSSVSLASDSGDIVLRSLVQPQGDARLESNYGTVRCEFAEKMNLRFWLRAGGAILWEKEAGIQGTTLEKQIGTFGPLLYAGSLKGSVVVSLKDAVVLQAPAPAAAPKATPSDRESGSGKAPSSDRGKDTAGEYPDQRPKLSRTPASPSQPQGLPEEPAKPDSPAPRDSQTPAPKNQPAAEVHAASRTEGPYSLKIEVDSVLLNVSVRDKYSNRSIPNLRKQDFQVYENGALQELDQMAPGEAPFNLLLLLDVSGSTRGFINLMREASADFIRQIKANDRIAIATFNSGVELIQDFTSDRTTAYRALQRINSGGGTAFYDALLTCVDDYMRGVEGRSAIVVFTDGVDNQLEGNHSQGSRTPFSQLYRRIQEIDPIIYTIFLDTEGRMGRAPGTVSGGGGVIDILGTVLGRGRRFPGRIPSPPAGRGGGNAPAYEDAREQLNVIAEQTGGRMYSPTRIEDLSQVYSEIADDLGIQYLLSYSSSNRVRDGKWREISVHIKDRPDLVARTRRGYYARQDKPPKQN